MKHLSLRRFNNLLMLIAAGLALYVLIAPFWPKATFEWKDDPPLANSTNVEAIPEENTLVIPKMKLQEVIHEGNKWALNKGVWHTPRSSQPDTGGNTVLTGHRFTYGGPSVFYHMGKVEKGDEITVYWQKKKYRYEVEQIQVVPPSNGEVLQETAEPRLTIYTCTPLTTAKNRLVIQARLIEDQNQ